MIRRQELAITKNIRNWLDSNPSFYAIESEVDRITTYVNSGNDFAIIRRQDAMRCNVDEIPKMAENFKPKIKNELLGIYEDLKDLERIGITKEIRR